MDIISLEGTQHYVFKPMQSVIKQCGGSENLWCGSDTNTTSSNILKLQVYMIPNEPL